MLKFRSLSKRNGILFGEGNVNTAFEAFTIQHKCNHYCEWFQLEELHDIQRDFVHAESRKRRTIDFIVGTLVHLSD